VVGKPRTYETDEGDVNVSIRPESINRVDERTRDRWVVETAERTLDRIRAFESESEGVDEYVEMARERYGDSVAGYKRAVKEALEGLEAEGAEANAD